MSKIKKAKMKIKPCPFCGEPARKIRSKADFTRWVRVSCVNAKCKIKPFVVKPLLPAAIEAWNTRKEPTS
jgi:hypothetical protein